MLLSSPHVLQAASQALSYSCSQSGANRVHAPKENTKTSESRKRDIFFIVVSLYVAYYLVICVIVVYCELLSLTFPYQILDALIVFADEAAKLSVLAVEVLAHILHRSD